MSFSGVLTVVFIIIVQKGKIVVVIILFCIDILIKHNNDRDLT